MLQISNMEDEKSDWNINETHMIIPMIDGEGDVTGKEPDKILTNALTLNPLEGGDQTILTNALEHSLVIGLDKNLFETPNYKSDLVIIQNSDLKLLSCGTDLKTPVAYTLSYVDQDKSEILWPGPKDRICGSEKAILEVRDVLNYDELDKNEQQINLECLESDITSQVTKTGGDILTNDTVVEQKKESQYITYYTPGQGGDTVSILPHLDTKFIENIKSVEPQVENSSYKLGKNILSITEPVLDISNSVPIKLVEFVKQKTEKKQKTKDDSSKGEETDEGFSHFLPEKSLPLKKKAKMKRTLVLLSSENQRSLLKQELGMSQPVNIKFSGERKAKKQQNDSLEEQNACNSDSDEPLSTKIEKRRKTNPKEKPKKSQKSILSTSKKEEESESKQLTNNTNNTTEESRTLQTTKHNFYGFDKEKFNNIYDLVECLRKCRMINTTVWQTLNSGLKEMNVDILREMNAKINELYSPEKTHYSAQLKAFALVLYFKQPAAFNHLAKEYKTGWPSLNIIKEWKRQMNSHQPRRERGIDNMKS